jgi:shikimate kinase
MSGPRATVVLIGPMGAGKTKVAKRVAKALGLPVRDSDQMIVAEHGPIADIFDTHGEPHFRELEAAAVAEALESGGVVSLGGGAVLHPDTRALLAEERVVLLTVTPEAVEPRIAGGKRPLVRGGLQDWIRIWEERRPVYEELAQLTLDTSARPYDQIAADVTDWTMARAR